MKIKSVHAWQIFDSRGIPTLQAEVLLEDGSIGTGIAPSGASTGAHEARENRDGCDSYSGKSVFSAVAAVNDPICKCLRGMDADNQHRIDDRLIELDGTEDKSNFGANALLAVSLAVAEAGAASARLPLYRWIGGLQAAELPCPMMNVLNGGRHAANNIDIQEFMLVPIGAEDFGEAMHMGTECYHALKALLSGEGLSTAVGDEGGFAPDIDSDERTLEYLMRAIEKAGWVPGEEVALAIDAAASEWRSGNGYLLPCRQEKRSREELIGYYAKLAEDFPLISIEDPLHEEDFDGFRTITEKLGGEVMIVGDDLFTTNCSRLLRGIEEGAANAVLIKPNQIGTLSETLDAVRLARSAGFGVILSHRSGDTESTAIADIAVAVNADYIKTGAPCRSERVAKYNRLLRIDEGMKGRTFL